jgi:hypothetical protein
MLVGEERRKRKATLNEDAEAVNGNRYEKALDSWLHVRNTATQEECPLHCY